MNAYRYYISFNSGTSKTEIFIVPIKIKTVREVEDDGRICYRDKFDDIKITQKLNSSVWATLLHYWDNPSHYTEKLQIYVYRGDSTTGTLFSTGCFSITDIVIDKQNGICSISPQPDDAYVIFDQLKDVSYYPPVAGGGYLYYKDAISGFTWNNGYASGTWDGWTNYSGGGSAGNMYGEKNASTPPTTYSYISIGSVVVGEKVEIAITGYSKTSGTDPYIAVINNLTAFTILSNTPQITASGTYVLTITTASTTGFLIVYQTTLNQVKFGFTGSSATKYYSRSFTGVPIATISLKDFLYGLITSNITGCLETGIDVVSTFLWNDSLPSTNYPPTIATYLASHSGYNYVTQAVNKLNDTAITVRSWITGGDGSGDISFTDFIISLCSYFDMFWYIDEDGKFRLEHTYWQKDLRTAGIDITTAGFAKNKPEVDQLVISQEKDKVFCREHWENTYNSSYGSGMGTDFAGEDICYDVYATSPFIKNHIISVLSTDLVHLESLSGENIDGFILLNCLAFTSGFLVLPEVGAKTGVNQLNGHFSMANLHVNYWNWERLATEGYINSVLTTFNSVIPLKKQSVKFLYTSDIDYWQSITTSQGNGVINQIERDLDTDFLTAELLHAP